MDTSHRLIALPLAFALCAGAFANDDMRKDPATNSDAVEKLKSSLPTSAGFEVDDVRMGDGVTCITYRVDNDRGGETRALAVVDGDKVLRSTSRSKSFETAWNSKCAGADRQAANK